ncbi:hypothetical protein BJ166DRAFT_627342 [Pestalotiopsis sp. NC0098]|nr:hypothetical protein BJ166DRAFT_627342 [Pestalotiopsis sp. NC0098]
MGAAKFEWINASHDQPKYDAEKKRTIRVQAMKAAAQSRKKTGTRGNQNTRQAGVVRIYGEEVEAGLPSPKRDEDVLFQQQHKQKQKRQPNSVMRARDAWRSKSGVIPIIRYLKSDDAPSPLHQSSNGPALFTQFEQCYARPARAMPLPDFERVSVDIGLNVLDLDELTAVAAGQAAGSLLAQNRASLDTLIVRRRQSYLFHIPARYGHCNYLDDALRCVAIRARRVLVPGTTGESTAGDSYRFYGRALRGLQAAVDKQSDWLDPNILGTIEILSIYEILESPTQPRNWEHHIAGATRLIMARGPSRFETEYEKALLASMISPIILESLRKGEPCFLDEEPWQRVLVSMIHKDVSYFAARGEGYMTMWILGARSPRIVVDLFRATANPKSLSDRDIDDLEARCRCMKADLEQWRRRTAEQEELERQQEAERSKRRASSLSSSPGSSVGSSGEGGDVKNELLGASLASLAIACRLLGAVSPHDRVELEAEAIGYAREMKELLAVVLGNKCTSFYLEQKIVAADSVLDTTDIWLKGLAIDSNRPKNQKHAPRIIENWKFLAWGSYLPID